MSHPATPGDRARVTAFVRAPPDRVFEAFTLETDVWWRRGPRHRTSPKRGTLRFEDAGGRRLVEAFDDGEVFEIGRVLAWEPGARIVLEWRLSNFAPGERTEVEVCFAPAEGGTQVTVEHRGWSTLRADHPARHGETPSVHVGRIGMWWGEQMSAMRAHLTTED